VSRLCSIVLVLETVVITLTIVPAVKLARVAPTAAAAGAGLAVIVAIVLAALAKRHLRVTIAGGSLLQLLVLASGFVLPAMFILGGIFSLLWITGIWLGHRVESSP
jgi:hypothetical protein